MKIAYITMQFPVPSEAFAAVELRALRRQGADLQVLSYRPAPASAEEMLHDRALADLPVDHGSFGSTLRGLLLAVLRPAETAYLLSEIFRHCRRRPQQLIKALLLIPRSLVLLERIACVQPDVVHLYWGHYPSLLGLLVRRQLPDIVISQFLGAYDLEEAFPLSGVMADRADYLVTLSRANVSAIVALGAKAEAVRISFHGVEVPQPLPAPEKTHGLMVVAERLVPQKCTADAVRVFARLRAAIPEVRLVVCGSGPELPRLQQQAKDLGMEGAVRFAGHLPHSELLSLLEQAEVTVTMSRSPSERLPNILKEAMLRRCLCLSTRTAGIEELIDDGDTGLIVELGDVDAAVGRLKQVLQHPPTAAEIGWRAQSTIVRDFDVDQLMAERLRQWSAVRQAREPGKAA